MIRRTVRRRYSGRLFGSMRSAFTLFVIGLSVHVSPGRSDDTIHQPQSSFVFKNSGVEISSNFPGGRLSDCRQVGTTTYVVSIRPENTPVNNSAWYAFRLRADKPQNIRLRLDYEVGTHRYWPKVSHDGRNWRRLEATKAHGLSSNEAEFALQIDSQPVWVAAQELLSLEESRDWSDRLASTSSVEKSVLGYSLQGRSITRLRVGDSTARNRVFIISRQHPPEVSGAIGMRHFVEAIAGPSPLARRFRQSFVTVVVPTVNPDGVAGGHWRHNAAGVDLNRDWGPFHQRETRALRDELLAIKLDPRRELRLFLDFHSTYEDVFYTQPPTALTRPTGFTGNWLTAIDRRFPDYAVKRSGGHGAYRPTSKHWVHKTFGIPAITYEFGDETDRGLIREIAHGAAEEMMRLLLLTFEEDSVAANASQ